MVNSLGCPVESFEKNWQPSLNDWDSVQWSYLDDHSYGWCSSLSLAQIFSKNAPKISHKKNQNRFISRIVSFISRKMQNEKKGKKIVIKKTTNKKTLGIQTLKSKKKRMISLLGYTSLACNVCDICEHHHSHSQ